LGVKQEGKKGARERSNQNERLEQPSVMGKKTSTQDWRNKTVEQKSLQQQGGRSKQLTRCQRLGKQPSSARSVDITKGKRRKELETTAWIAAEIGRVVTGYATGGNMIVLRRKPILTNANSHRQATKTWPGARGNGKGALFIGSVGRSSRKSVVTAIQHSGGVELADPSCTSGRGGGD